MKVKPFSTFKIFTSCLSSFEKPLPLKMQIPKHVSSLSASLPLTAGKLLEHNTEKASFQSYFQNTCTRNSRVLRQRTQPPQPISPPFPHCLGSCHHCLRPRDAILWGHRPWASWARARLSSGIAGQGRRSAGGRRCRALGRRCPRAGS